MAGKYLIFLIWIFSFSISIDFDQVNIPRFVFNPRLSNFNTLKSFTIMKSNNFHIPNDTLCKESISKLFKQNVKDPLFRPFLEYGGKGLNSFGN